MDCAQVQQHGGDPVSSLRVRVAWLLRHELSELLDGVRRLAEPERGAKVVGEGSGRHRGVDTVGLDDGVLSPLEDELALEASCDSPLQPSVENLPGIEA